MRFCAVASNATRWRGAPTRLSTCAAAFNPHACDGDSQNTRAHRPLTPLPSADLVSKEAALQVTIGGKTVHIGGMCKGSGMIHPNMATMLGVVTCDAAVEPKLWTAMVKRASMNSFNSITVDGDTSTNDTVIGLASGAAGVTVSDPASADAKLLESALTALMRVSRVCSLCVVNCRFCCRA